MARTVPGSGAVISANFNSSYGIESFTISNGGTGYASTDPPQISITGTTVPTTAGSFYPIIVNGEITSIKILSSGSGYSPLVSVASTAVGIASITRVGNNEFTVGNDIVSAILLEDPGFGYSSQPTVTIADPPIISGAQGNFRFNEIVRGERSRAEARVREWDNVNALLKVSHVSIGSTIPIGFFPGEMVVGTESGASWMVQVYSHDDTYDKYTENDEFETLGDNLLDFTETNPFGTF